MRYTLLVIFIGWINPLLSQEIKISVQQGYTIAETPAAKKIMLYSGTIAGMEWRIGERAGLTAGLGAQILQAGYDDGNSNRYEKRFIVQVPVSVKKYYPLSKRSAGFLETGGYLSHNILWKTEIRQNGLINNTTKHGAGWNAGINFGAGFRTVLTQRLLFSAGLVGQKDLWDKYVKPGWKLRTKGTSLVLCFYRKLGK